MNCMVCGQHITDLGWEPFCCEICHDSSAARVLRVVERRVGDLSAFGLVRLPSGRVLTSDSEDYSRWLVAYTEQLRRERDNVPADNDSLYADRQGNPITVDEWSDLVQEGFDARILRETIVGQYKLRQVWTGNRIPSLNAWPFGLILYPKDGYDKHIAVLGELDTLHDLEEAFIFVKVWMENNPGVLPTADLIRHIVERQGQA